MLALHTHAQVDTLGPRCIYKVLGITEALDNPLAPETILVDLRGGAPRVELQALHAAGFAGILADELPSKPVPQGFVCVSNLRAREVVAPGDVIRLRARGQLSVLFRRGANANFLLVTERCNSACLMCSQPPRDDADGWRVDEILKTIPLIDEDVPHLGLTGGEPTLLGPRLGDIIRCAAEHLPHTQLNILSNGRLLGDARLADRLCIHDRVLWAIPLYADTAARHDYVVQAAGAFEETILGLYNLAERGAAIELRVVLHAQTIGRLKALSEFIWRSLPFVAHVAFMGLEPMGFARQNRSLLQIDPLDYREALEDAAWYLHDRGIATSIYNTPLCLLPRRMWPLARRSISDWKNVYAPDCAPCQVRDRCSGFFKSAGPEWRSRGIRPITMEGIA
jgi:His-Xaa-Ser system radical SAM maturase HxsC